jgi:uncharacterized coiled-coil protein SlyX
MGKDEDIWDDALSRIGKELSALREAVTNSAADASRVAELERQLSFTKEAADKFASQLAEREAEVAKLSAANSDLSDRLAKPEGADGTVDARVAELERQLADLREQHGNDGAHFDAMVQEYKRENAEQRDLLATAYVAREVPWTDVAAGMMTIARDGTAWMVEQVLDNDLPIAFRLRNGGQTFTKTIDPGPVDTVRVLVPYVTEEQAEGLVASELGGKEVGS